MTSMPVRSCLWALAVAWVVASGLYSFPAFQEEVAEKRYLARIARVQAPVIPVDCSGARGVESRDFIREDKNRHRCWVDLASFRRLYPEIAEYTDEAASARINMQAELPLDKWDGSPLEELLKAGALALSLPVLLAAGVRFRKTSAPVRHRRLAGKPAPGASHLSGGAVADPLGGAPLRQPPLASARRHGHRAPCLRGARLVEHRHLLPMGEQPEPEPRRRIVRRPRHRRLARMLAEPLPSRPRFRRPLQSDLHPAAL